MAAIISININLSKLDKTKFFQGETGKFCRLDVTVNNELSEYKQQGYVTLERSKEERDAGTRKVFCGDAECRWTDGRIMTKRELEGQQTQPPAQDPAPYGQATLPGVEKGPDDIPF